MRLEKSPGDAETARSLRRTVHTLKGDAAACGFRELSELCHEFEDVLTLGNTAAAASVPEIALRAADVFAALLEAYRKGTKLPSIQSLRADIARLAHPAARRGAAKAKKQDKESRREDQPLVGIRTTGDRPGGGGGQARSSRGGGDRPAVRHAHRRTPDDPVGSCRTGRGAGSLSGRRQSRAHHRIEAALASEKPAEQIRAKCSIPTIALNVKVTPLRAPAPSHPLPPASAGGSEGTDS